MYVVVFCTCFLVYASFCPIIPCNSTPFPNNHHLNTLHTGGQRGVRRAPEEPKLLSMYLNMPLPSDKKERNTTPPNQRQPTVIPCFMLSIVPVTDNQTGALCNFNGAPTRKRNYKI